VTADDPIRLFFGDMTKLGPGSDAETLQVLLSLPAVPLRRIVDAGCGAGRQTIVLARALRATIHAVDNHQPFLDTLVKRAEAAGVAERLVPHCIDMSRIAERFSGLDLIWSEGAAYNIGFANALAVWSPALRPGGFLVASELSWLTDARPSPAAEFFATCYPDMKHRDDNAALAERAGYRLLGTRTLPREAWTEDYYDRLGPRARSLADHPSSEVRDFARETLREIAVFGGAGDSYGYVFYILQRP
jgi:SAM-dependent methyltransferase